MRRALLLGRAARALFGEGEESTLRDQIEEAIDESEDEAPKARRPHLGRAADAAQHAAFRREDRRRRGGPARRHHRGESRISFAELVAPSPMPGHSRLPVYEDSLDKVVGMIHLKDVFARMVSGEDPPEDIMTLVREPLYVPESMGMPDLLASMRAQRIHLAIVVDEFGGTEGLVTIEDVVEEITGEIEDEHDEEQEGSLIPIEGGGWDADARAELDEVAQIVDPRLAEVEEDVDTLGGLAVVLAGHVPQQGEVVEHPSGWRLEVTECEPRRVTRLRLHPPEDMETVG
jgi:CBS domain containing-hemolysin-like protein